MWRFWRREARGEESRASIFKVLLATLVLTVVLAGACWGLIRWGLSTATTQARADAAAEIARKMTAIREGRAKSFELYETEGTDGLLEAVASLPGLEEVGLDRTDVTDAGIGHLATNPRLKSLVVCWCPHITDSALRYVGAMPALEHLALYDLAITDKGIAALRRCSTLRRLELFTAETPSPDRTLRIAAYLKQLPQLRTLEVRGEWVTETAVQELHQSLPHTAMGRSNSSATLREWVTLILLRHNSERKCLEAGRDHATLR